MIKINLLPRTINEKAIIRNTALAFAVLFIAIIVGGLTYASCLSKQVADKETEAQAAEAWEARVQGIQKQAQDQTASIKPIKDKLDFINAVLKFNGEYPKLYAEVAKWTYEKVMYTSMICDGTQVVMTARTKDLDYLGRYLLNMYRATDFFTEVTISGVPGYGQNNQNNMMGGGLPGGMPMMPSGPAFEPAGAQSSLAGIGAISSSMQRTPGGEKWVDFTVTCKLKTPIAAPSFAAGAGAAAGGAAGAPGGAPSTMPGGPGGPMPPMPGAGGMTPMPPSGG
ncbi:MAG: PilN domain-containing protein [Armatimonadota bacterium]